MKLTAVIILSLSSAALAAPTGVFDKFCSNNVNQGDCYQNNQNRGISDPTAEVKEKDADNDGARPISFEVINPKVVPDDDDGVRPIYEVVGNQSKCDCSKPFVTHAEYDEYDTDGGKCPAGYEDPNAHLSIPYCAQVGCSESNFKAECSSTRF